METFPIRGSCWCCFSSLIAYFIVNAADSCTFFFFILTNHSIRAYQRWTCHIHLYWHLRVFRCMLMMAWTFSTFEMVSSRVCFLSRFHQTQTKLSKNKQLVRLAVIQNWIAHLCTKLYRNTSTRWEGYDDSRHEKRAEKQMDAIKIDWCATRKILKCIMHTPLSTLDFIFLFSLSLSRSY